MDNLNGKLQSTLDRVLAVTVDTNERIKIMEEKVADHDEKFDTVIGNQDWMIGTLTRLDQERMMTIKMTDDLRKNMDDLKKRVTKLETATV